MEIAGNGIDVVSGGKGGIGKSLVVMGRLDYLSSVNRDPALLETDIANPDVGKSYKDEVSRFATLDISKNDAWIDLANFIESTEKNIVVNAAAGLGTSDSVKNLGDGLAELGRDLRMFWVLNTQRDGLILLKSFLDVINDIDRIKIFVIRNGYFGDPGDFKLFNSELQERVLARGGKVLDFPALSSRCVDPLYVERLSIARAIESFPFGSRLELKRWRSRVHEMFSSIEIEKED